MTGPGTGGCRHPALDDLFQVLRTESDDNTLSYEITK